MKHSRLYATSAWRKLRAAHLVDEPFCRSCLEIKKQYKAAECVDHVIPHGDNLGRFYSHENLQSLCTACHGLKSEHERVRGKNSVRRRGRSKTYL